MSLLQNPGESYATGDASGSSLAGGLGAHLSDVQGAASSLSSSAQRGVSGAPGAFSSAGGRAALSFSSAIGSASAYGSGAQLAGTARSGLGSVDAGSTGENFVRGFTGGFGRIDVFRAACDIGNRALDAIKRTLGIASPSKFDYQSECHCSKTRWDTCRTSRQFDYQSECHCSKTFHHV